MNAAIESLLGLRESVFAAPRSGEADWIGRVRAEALATFEELGIPTRRLEEWKGTNLARLEAVTFERIGNPQATPVVVTGDGVPELHFVDGRLDTANSQAANLPRGVRLLSLAEACRQAPELLEGRLAQLTNPKRQALVALQTAFLDDGAVLAIEPGIELDSPIRLRFQVSASSRETPSAVFPRLLVIAGESSRATIHVEHESAASPDQAIQSEKDDRLGGLTAFVAELHLAAGAQIESIQIQNEDSGRMHFTSTHARLERGARFDSYVFSLSEGLVRSELEVTLAGAGAETRMQGFFLGHGNSHVDHFTTVDHAAESCTSNEEYRGVLGDRSAGVFRGRVIVRPGAQKTDARQSNPNLLISEHATVDSKPQLEIYADDIRASHGSTTGQLDQEALFFLRARGIDTADARLMLTRAFAHGIVDGIANQDLRESVATRIDDTLALDASLPASRFISAQPRDSVRLRAAEASSPSTDPSDSGGTAG